MRKKLEEELVSENIDESRKRDLCDNVEWLLAQLGSNHTELATYKS